jgi:hypothetical protein
MGLGKPAADHIANPIISEKTRNRGWKNQKRGGENDGDDSGLIDLQGYERALSSVDFVPYHAFGVLNRKPSLPFLKDYTARHYRQNQDQEQQYGKNMRFALSKAREYVYDRTRKTYDYTGEDHDGYAVAYAVVGYFFAQPHDNYRTGRQGRNYYNRAKKSAR